MKRLLCTLLSCLTAALLLCSSAASAVAAGGLQAPEDVTPVIILPGYSGPQLVLDYGLDTEEQVWIFQVKGETVRSLGDVVLDVLPKLIKDSQGNAEDVVKRFGDVYPLFNKLEMNDDGSSMYDITPIPNGARNARWDVMVEREQERLNNQRALTYSLAERMPSDHIYLFSNDWRRGQVDGTAALHAFIQEVKADSGHDKVSLFGVSYGGQLLASYLSFYGGEDIDRAILHSPAILGSSLTVDLLEKEDFAFDPALILDFAGVFMERELSLNQRLEGVISIEQYNDIIMQVIRTHLWPLCVKFGSFWDIVPPEDYERLKAKHLDPVKNAEIIRKSDIIHYEMMPNISETLQRVQAQGVKVALIVGSGHLLASGTPIESDVIIEVASTAGALAQPMDAEASVGIPAQAVCTNETHTHRSPDGRIDASCAYLPDHTWFFRGQYHGQGPWDAYARALYYKLLFTDDIQDVYSDPEFPQFRDSCNPSDGLEARFSGSVSGYLTEEDELLLLKNLSEHEIDLLSVKAEGLQFDVPISSRFTLRPGETARLRYKAILPQEQQIFSVTVEFIRGTAVPAKETRTFVFTALPVEAKMVSQLRYTDTGAVDAAPLRVRPVRALLISLALTASLVLASLAVGVMQRGKLLPAGPQEPKRQKAARPPRGKRQ